MYISLLLFAAVLVPIPLIVKSIMRREGPYKACMDGIIGAGFAMVFVFILASQGENSIGKSLPLPGKR